MSQPTFREVSLETAFNITEQMRADTKTEHDTRALKIISGVHPEHGALHVLFPIVGDSILLSAALSPIAVQSSDV